MRSAESTPRRRRLLWLVPLALVVTLAWDLTRAPADQWSAQALIGGIHLYRRTLGPWSPAIGARCRFEPTCSHYGEAVIRHHGAARGSWLAVRRIARCGPWTPMGTADPPP